jgi:hypothetical protein
MGGRDSLDHADFRRLQSPNDLVLHIRIDPNRGVVVLANPQNLFRVLRGARALRDRLNLPGGGAVDRLLVQQRVFVLPGDSLLEIFEAEVCAEKPRVPILHRNPTVPFQRRRPHP